MGHFSILFEISVAVLLVGCVVAFLVGLGLLTIPQFLFALNRMSNRWISTRQLFRNMSAPISVDPWVFAHRKGFGTVLFLATALVMIQMTFIYNMAQTIHYFSQYFNEQIVILVERIVYWVVWIGSGFGMLIACLLLAGDRTAAWCTLQKSKWYSARVTTKFLEVPYHYRGPEHLAATHPRIFGIFLMVSSVYIASVFLSLLK